MSTMEKPNNMIKIWYCKRCDKRYKSFRETESCMNDNHEFDVLNEPKTRSQRIVAYEHGQSIIGNVCKSKTDTEQIVVQLEVGGETRWYDLKSSLFIQKLKVQTKEMEGDILSEEAYKSAIGTLHAEYIIDDKLTSRNILKRCAYEDGVVYYDTGKDVVKISKEGIEHVHYNDKDVPIFLKTTGGSSDKQPDIVPYTGEDNPIEEYINLLRIPDEDKIIFKSHFISGFIQDISSPIYLFNGEQDSAKTSTANSIKNMIDPESPIMTSMPKDIDDLAVALSHKYLANFDNMSFITHELSDFLCQVVTGVAHEKRTLYTNADPYIINLKSKIILNGIQPNMDRADLLDRIINYELPPIEERISDKKLKETIAELKPRVLGQVFHIIHESLKIKDDVESELEGVNLPRMADFAIWSESFSRVLGNEANDFITRYWDKIKSLKVSLADKYPLIRILQRFMGSKPRLEIALKDLHQSLTEQYRIAQDDFADTKSNFPAKPDALGRQLKQVAPTLREIGIHITTAPYNNRDGKYERGSVVATIINKGALEIEKF